MQVELNKYGRRTLRRMYFVGIGGIGMSALARYFSDRGVEIFGYDRTESELTRQLSAAGMHITYRDDAAHIPGEVDLAVFTPAIPVDNAILQCLIQSSIPTLKRAEVLGAIVHKQKTVAVAGTHGKTTTSAMTAFLLHTCGIEATAILGGLIPQFNGNYIHGNSQWVVVEADEYDRSFLYLRPDIAIVTSIDADHLDIYGTREEMVKTYIQFMEGTKAGGTLLIHKNVTERIDPTVIKGLSATRTVIQYGLSDSDCSDGSVHYTDGLGHFVWNYDGQVYPAALKMPGEHNVSNAMAAMHAAAAVGVSPACVALKLRNFNGIWRRFETKYRDDKHVIIDDYAHHPTELTAAIQTARALFPEWRLTGIFQPHLYSRTRDFLEGFAWALEGLDAAWILDIYPAREQPIEGVTAESIQKKMRGANVHLASKNTIVNQLKIEDKQVILVLGAGDLHLIIPDLISKIKQPLH